MTSSVALLYESFINHGRYVLTELTQLRWNNYLLWLTSISLFCLALERWRPWRVQDAIRRQDFWLDLFYLVFNFLLFPLIGFQAVATVVDYWSQQTAGSFGLNLNEGYFPGSWPGPLRIAVLFVARDFIQWLIHRLLHRIPLLWRFHTTHHSASVLGFATHFRFHPMETIVYRSLEYLPLALLGFGVTDMFVAHIFAILVGHLNHTNTYVPLGPLKYLLNNPQMHRWHHALELPKPYGVNFGLSLSLWDYLFGTAYLPHDGRNIVLGVASPVPHKFWAQLLDPFKRR